MKKVFYENLPKWENGTNKGKINWRKSAETNAEVKFIYDSLEGEMKIVGYNNYRLIIEYDNQLFNGIKTDNFSNCKIGNILGTKSDKYKFKIGDVIKDDKRNLKILELIRIKNGNYTTKAYKYQCLNDGYIGEITESNLIQEESGCPVCTNKIVIKGINDIATTHPHLVKYFVNIEDAYKYSYSSKVNVKLKCPDCGFERELKIQILSSFGFSCPQCGDGKPYPEKFMFSILKQLKINFEVEKKFEWCRFNIDNNIKKGRYDFYFELDDKKYIIETDGYFHFNNNHMNNQSKQVSQFIDNEKDRLAHEHKIEVIRVDCKESNLEYIKNNIIEKLSDLFNFDTIDWLECHKCACDSLVKQVCDLWNKIQSVKDICEITKLSNTTVNSYLNKGKIIGLCNYNGKDIMRENGRKRATLNNIKHKNLLLN